MGFKARQLGNKNPEGNKIIQRRSSNLAIMKVRLVYRVKRRKSRKGLWKVEVVTFIALGAREGSSAGQGPANSGTSAQHAEDVDTDWRPASVRVLAKGCCESLTRCGA